MDLVQICRAITLGASPSLLIFWSHFWFVEQFPCIYRQTADQIYLKSSGPTNFYGPSLAWLTFGHAPLNSHSFLACDWSKSYHAFTDNPLIKLLEFRFGGKVHFGPPVVWLTCGHALLNSRCSMASDWLSSFGTFADKQLIGFSWNLVGYLVISFSWT